MRQCTSDPSSDGSKHLAASSRNLDLPRSYYEAPHTFPTRRTYVAWQNVIIFSLPSSRRERKEYITSVTLIYYEICKGAWRSRWINPQEYRKYLENAKLFCKWATSINPVTLASVSCRVSPQSFHRWYMALCRINLITNGRVELPI